MKLKIIRYSSGTDSTLGLLFINDAFAAYTLEDEFRKVKEPGKTRIPAGTYRVKLRKEGGHHQRYSKKFADMHKGMLHISDVPNFKWILIHIGNTDDDTDGCLLVGDIAVSNVAQEGRVNSSTTAYKRIYPLIASAIEKGEEVWVSVLD